MAEVRAGRTRHWLNNLILEPDGDDVRGLAYQMMVKNTIDPPSIEIIITGTHRELLETSAHYQHLMSTDADTDADAETGARR